MVHVTPHFALCAPAFGRVGVQIAQRIEAVLVRTSMASGGAPTREEEALFAAANVDRLETNNDLAMLLRHLCAQPETRAIVLAVAVCDWDPVSLESSQAAMTEFGKDVLRLRTSAGDITLKLTPSDKLVSGIHTARPDVVLVAFKATAGLTQEETLERGRGLRQRTAATLVLANDVQRGTNIVVGPDDEAHFGDTRETALDVLAAQIRHAMR